jgi:phosphatidylglycerol:prolipoprotein diacylglycerol transferase
VVHRNYYVDHPLEVFELWRGAAFLGGPLVIIPFVAVYVPLVGLPLWKTYDLMALGLCAALAVTRVGCFCEGCCHGCPTSCPLGVRFDSDTVDPACRGLPLHPTQLYEAFGVAVLFVFLVAQWRRRSFPGQVFLVFFMAYAVLRGLIEVVRGDSVRGFVVPGWVSTSQLVGLLLFLLAVPFYLLRRRRCDVLSGENV